MTSTYTVFNKEYPNVDDNGRVIYIISYFTDSITM